MGNAITAIAFGDDYQAMVFWEYANKMLYENSEIQSIGYEYDEVKSFDDVVIMYNTHQQYRDGVIIKDYIQVKFHVTQTKCITIENLLDPSFVNASTYSFMDKVVLAYRNDPICFSQSRFILYTPWDIDQSDSLYTLIDNVQKAFRLENIFDNTTTDRSAMGQIRKKFKDKLSLTDEELRAVLKQVCIYDGKYSVVELEEKINTEFRFNHLIEWPKSRVSNQYVSLIRGWMKAGKKTVNAEELIEQCKREGLFATEKKEGLLAIRSFEKYTEGMAERANAFLDLAPFFRGRFILEDCTWEQINTSIEGFIKSNALYDTDYTIELAVNHTIAFMVGRFLNSKSGLRVMPLQRTIHGLLNWDVRDGKDVENPLFEIEEENGDSDSKDIAVLMSISSNIYGDVMQHCKEKGIVFKKIYHCILPGLGNDAVCNGYHAWTLAEQVNRIIESRKIDEKRGMLHIFVAGPWSVMFDLGKMSMTYGKIQLYEYDMEHITDDIYHPTIHYPMEEEE